MFTEPNHKINELVDSLPTVLSIPLAEYERETNPVLALWAASDLMEIALKFLVMAALGEHEELPAELQEELRDKQLERPTFGNWMGMAETIVKHLPADTRLPEIPSSVFTIRELLGTNESSESEGLLSTRNQFLAHGGPSKRNQAEKLLNIWKPKVNEVVLECFHWLTHVKLLALDLSGESFLLQGEEAVAWQGQEMAPVGAQAGSAWLLNEGLFLPLGPLTTFDTEERALNIYIRCEEVGLQYLRMDDEGGFQESGSEEVEWFKRRFHSQLKNQSTIEFTIRSFESEIRKEAARRVGRAEELKKLLYSLRSMDRGYLWIGGPAGIGKSNLMCCAMEALLDDPLENVLVLPYLFRAGDDRCGKESFLRFLRERLEKNEWLIPDEISSEEEKEEGSQNKKVQDNPIKELRDLFSRLQEGKKVLLLLDGLDEVAERSPRFVEDIVFGICSDLEQVLLAGAARPEFGIPESFLSRGAIDPFPKGLPSMSENDARAFLLERAGNVRKRMLALDKEKGEEVSNRFFSKVAERSDGLPIYLNCLLHDLHQGKISPENTDSLPRGIHAYHEELLQRHSLGDFQAVATPSLVILAMAHEPLTNVELTVFLKRLNRIGTENLELIDMVLRALSSMLKRAPDPDGEEGYTLYHHSLREHILNSSNLSETVTSIRNSFSNSILRPSGDALDLYLYRCGVSHLLENNRRDDAVEWMTDFELTMSRLQALDFSGRAADGWYADWELLAKGTKLSGDWEIWWDFARINRHHFRKPGWESWRVFFQAAMDHADDSPVTMGAEKFYANSKCDWTWLRLVNRPMQWKPSLLCFTFVGDLYGVRGLKILSESRFLSWYSDGTLRIWDINSETPMTVLEGHTDSVIKVEVLNNGRILSWSNDETLRIWDAESGSPVVVLEGHIDYVSGVEVLCNGRILTWSDDNTLRLWDAESGSPLALLKGHIQSVNGAKELSNGRILSWSNDNTLRLWDASGVQVVVLEGHNDYVSGVEVLSNGRILSWSGDGTLRLWDATSGAPLGVLKDHKDHLIVGVFINSDRILSWSDDYSLRLWDANTGALVGVLEGHKDFASGVEVLSNGRILTWSDDNTLRLWDAESGSPLALLKGHIQSVSGAKELSNGRILSWSNDKTLRLWDANTGAPVGMLEGHKDYVNGVEVLSDGRILTWSDDNTLRLWDSESGVSLGIMEGHIYKVEGAIVLLNGRILSWGDNTIRLWDAKNLGVPGHQKVENYNANDVRLLSNGRILTWSDDNTLRIWDAESGSPLALLKGHIERVNGAEELSNGRILSWSDDNTLRIWDAESGSPLALLKGHIQSVSGAKELSNGRILTCSDDNTLRLWDAESGSPLALLKGHIQTVSGAKELSNGRILTWSDDNML